MQSFHLIDSLTERGAGRELSSEGFVDHFDLRIQPLILVFGVQLFVYVMCVMTPPVVGSTWLRVRSTLESDCLPVLSQGTASLCSVVD